MKNWKKKGWVKSDGEPVKNKEELIVLDAAMEGLAVKWVSVSKILNPHLPQHTDS